MNHKILEQIKGGAFLAGDLPMSTSSIYNVDFDLKYSTGVGGKICDFAIGGRKFAIGADVPRRGFLAK